jgi:hypothetical protein
MPTETSNSLAKGKASIPKQLSELIKHETLLGEKPGKKGLILKLLIIRLTELSLSDFPKTSKEWALIVNGTFVLHDNL